MNPARDFGPRLAHSVLPIAGKGQVGLGLCVGSDPRTVGRWRYRCRQHSLDQVLRLAPAYGREIFLVFRRILASGVCSRAAPAAEEHNPSTSNILRFAEGGKPVPELVHTGVMKKLINSPQEVVREALEGMEAAHGDRLRINYDPAYIVRKDAPVKGKVGFGVRRRQRPRTDARRLCRQRHAGCGLPGRRSSPALLRTRCMKPAKPSMAAPESCTSSRTTPATS